MGQPDSTCTAPTERARGIGAHLVALLRRGGDARLGVAAQFDPFERANFETRFSLHRDLRFETRRFEARFSLYRLKG
jgi:hypothetical protein